ncbi:MAG: DUF2284 domain-containing protein [Clostridium sp.]|uniref:DUF2284 domain-containing protein n=1 Tax=Clostridium culturomicium TaxID=1499683 RepID=UPI0029079DAC|nr:DUF2284 domain-containing protein [Clostridium sp.]MDU7086047.1 DUF2284 domain-containing protein [Clostridium sp.]
MINYVSYKINPVSLEDITKFYNPLVINKFCSECTKHNKVWSCPPLPFKDIDYISKYKYCYIIHSKVYIKAIPSNILSEMVSHALKKYTDISNGKDDFTDIFNGLYYSFREFNDSKILQLEESFTNSIALVSGRCLICSTCTRETNTPCRYPEKLRYSLEGLGFDVAGIVENIVGEKIQWSSSIRPEYVTCVSALLSSDDIDPNEILNKLTK